MKQFKNPDFYRSILLLLLLTPLFIFSVGFLNATHYYEQQIPLKWICILFALTVLVLSDVKNVFTIPALIFLPIGFFATKIGYEKHWIPDVCNYTHVDVLRLDKITILLWGIVIISFLWDFFRHKGYKRFAHMHRGLLILWVIYALWLTAFQQTHYAYVLLFSIGFTSLYYALTNPERKKIFFRAFLYGLILSSFYIMYKSLLYRPYDTERYNGYFYNSNNAGFYYATVFLALFSRIHAWWESSCKKAVKIPMLVLLYLYTGFLGCINLFNYTRTTLTGILFSVVILFIMEMVKNKGKRFKTFGKYGLLLLSMILLFNLTYLAIRYIPAKIDNPHFFTWECDEENDVLKGDPADSPKYTSMTQYLRVVFGKWGIYIKVDDVEANEFEKEHGNEDVTFDKDRDVTNGRTEIWKRYLPLMRIFGHDPANLVDENGEIIYHAHNTYFQTAYQYGIPAGIMLLLLTLWCFIQNGKGIIKKKEFSYERIFSFFMTGTCLIGFFTEWFGHPAYPICIALYACFGFTLLDKDSVD